LNSKSWLLDGFWLPIGGGERVGEGEGQAGGEGWRGDGEGVKEGRGKRWGGLEPEGEEGGIEVRIPNRKMLQNRAGSGLEKL
jgi:hypothetical protein